MKNILLVDDDAEVSQSLANLFDEEKFNFNFLEDGTEVGRYLTEHDEVDLVMLDMIMEAGFDGLDTFVAIRKLRPSQRAIIVTGYSETDRVKKACKLGVLKCVRKPYSIDLIGKVLRGALA